MIYALILMASLALPAWGGPEPVYAIEVDRVVDGDTIHVGIDTGLRVAMGDTLRLYDVDTPELRGEDKVRGLAAKEFTDAWLRGDDPDGPYLEELWIDTVKFNARGKYGRLLAYVYRADDPVSLNAALVAAGHVK